MLARQQMQEGGKQDLQRQQTCQMPCGTTAQQPLDSFLLPLKPKLLPRLPQAACSPFPPTPPPLLPRFPAPCFTNRLPMGYWPADPPPSASMKKSPAWCVAHLLCNDVMCDCRGEAGCRGGSQQCRPCSRGGSTFWAPQSGQHISHPDMPADRYMPIYL